MRNTGVLAMAVFVAILVMQPFIVAQTYLVPGFDGTIADMLVLELILMVPTAVAGAVVGFVAGFGIKTAEQQKWSYIVAGLVLVLMMLSTWYIAPGWYSWLTSIARIVVPAVLAWLSFRLVRHRRPPSGATGSQPVG